MKMSYVQLDPDPIQILQESSDEKNMAMPAADRKNVARGAIRIQDLISDEDWFTHKLKAAIILSNES